MTMPGFIFGGNEPMSYEQLQRQREIADALLAQNMRAPSTFGEGLVTVGRAIAAKRKNKKADAREGELRGEFDNRFNSLFAGGGSGFGSGGGSYGGGSYTPAPPKSQWNQGTDVSAADVSAMGARGDWNGGTMDTGRANTFGQGDAAGGYNMGAAVKTEATPESLKAGLVARGLPEHVAEGFVMNFDDESGFNPGINEASPLVPGSRGGFGLYQLTGPRRKAYEAYAAERGVDPSDVDAQLDFMMMELQGPEASAANAIMGTSNAGEAGAAIVNNFLRPAEEHRNSRASKYLSGGGVMPQGNGAAGMGGSNSAPVNPAMFGQIDDSVAQPQPGGLTGGFAMPQGGGGGGLTGGFDIGALAALAADPMASPEQKAILNLLLEQQTNAMDPLYQMQLEEQRLKLAQMQGGGQPEALAEREAMARAGGLQPNTPEWNTYMLTGELPKGSAKPMTPEERAMWGIDPNDKTPYAMGENGIPKAITAGGTNISVNTGTPELGKLSTDYGFVMDPATGKPVIDPATGLPKAAPVPGSPADLEAKAAAEKAALANEASTQTASVVLGKLDQLDKIIDESNTFNPATGFGAETAAGIGGTNAANAKAVIDTVKANVGFETLAAMRAASPTGGALGAISDSEMTLLTSTLASLAQTQDPKQMKQHIAELRQIYSGIMAKAAAYPNAAQFGYGGQSAPTAAPIVTDDGYTIEVVE